MTFTTRAGTAMVLAAVACGVARPAAALTYSRADLERAEVVLSIGNAAEARPLLPLRLTVTVSNPTTETITIPVPTLSEYARVFSTLDVLYTREPGAEPTTRVENLLPYFGPKKEGVVAERPQLMSLAPGGSTVLEAPLSHEWARAEPLPLVDVGIVRLRARLCALELGPDGEWTVVRDDGELSAVVPVEVDDPTGAEGDGLAATRLLARRWVLAAPQSLDHLPHGHLYGAVQRLVDDTPGTTYALYGKGALAHMVGRGDRLDLDPVRPPDPAAGIALVDEVLADGRYVPRGDLQALREALASMLGGGP